MIAVSAASRALSARYPTQTAIPRLSRLVAVTVDPPAARAAQPPAPVRLAGILVGFEALMAIAFAVVLLVSAVTGAQRAGDVVALGVLFLMFGGGLATVAVGLVAGRRWARSPGLVTQFLLLPVVYSLLGPSRQVALGLATGVLVITTLVLLLGQQSKRWAMDAFDEPD